MTKASNRLRLHGANSTSSLGSADGQHLDRGGPTQAFGFGWTGGGCLLMSVVGVLALPNRR